ncbi:aminopeptidase [bacterium]|nr:aminopeptidase [bacterium]
MDAISQFNQEFCQDPKNMLAMNAVTKNSITDVAMSRNAFVNAQHTFSHLVPLEGKATSQKSSGRCWIFAALNVMRLPLMAKHNLEEFEFSQSYMFFWDKFEKSNYFLESIIDTKEKPVDDRTVMWLFQTAISDGGQWDMFVNLINKYGVVPKDAMPESYASSNSGLMNRMILHKLREYAKQLRDLDQSGSQVSELRKLKNNQMQEIYRILCIFLGEPPKKFDWQFRDKDKKFFDFQGITPKEFMEKHVPFNINDKVCLVNAPTKDKPLNNVLTVKYLGNIVEGFPTRYLNVDIDVVKQAAAASIKDGEAVWFGCDVGKRFHRDIGVMDMDLYDYKLVIGTDTALNKGARLDYGDSAMTHAMVFTGVDIQNDQIEKWRVENSWGDKVGSKGYFIMTDKWFDEFNYEVVVDKKYVSENILDIAKQKPIELNPWDPMGSLAR